MKPPGRQAGRPGCRGGCSSGYSGWLVVEQDLIPAPDEDERDAMDAQARNRQWLTEVAGL